MYVYCEVCDHLLDDDGVCGECEFDISYPYEGGDPVNNPAHYGQGAIECIEYIRDFLSEDEYIGYLRGNIAKYLHRWRYKDGIEDLSKAQWYLNELTTYLESE